MSGWDYGRTILRQDEVAAFIHDTKGGKYSALLPLFGLQPLEVAAQNIRQLVKEIGQQFEIAEIRIQLSQLDTAQKKVFGSDTEDQVAAKIRILHKKYVPDKATTTDNLVRCDEIAAALDARIAQFPPLTTGFSAATVHDCSKPARADQPARAF